jgi:hypothetical protein
MYAVKKESLGSLGKPDCNPSSKPMKIDTIKSQVKPEASFR